MNKGEFPMSTSAFLIRRTVVVLLVVSFVSVSQTGCSSSVSVVAKQASKADDVVTKTEVALWWGVSDPVQNVDCSGNGLQFVSVKTNWFYSLCTVVTLGAVAPMDVEYRCTSTPPQDGGVIGN
jgi:hypothetical protein